MLQPDSGYFRWFSNVSAIAVSVAYGVLGGGALRPTRDALAQTPDKTEVNQRCAVRLSIAFLGESPEAALIQSPNPQSFVDLMMANPKFIDRFSRFANAEMNGGPGQTAAEDVTYYTSKYILENGRAWKDLFVGPFKFTAGAGGVPIISIDPQGLGYFRSDAWLKRYAGNEEAGIKIVSAFRILNNTTGLDLQAVTNASNVDVSATGRAKEGCKNCHYENWYALDQVAKVLTLRKGQAEEMTFVPNTAGPQQLLGKTIANDKELVEALVDSESFRFNACRSAFKFLYGRPENKCESDLFDQCMKAFTARGTIQTALSTIAKDGSYCQ